MKYFACFWRDFRLIKYSPDTTRAPVAQCAWGIYYEVSYALTSSEWFCQWFWWCGSHLFVCLWSVYVEWGRRCDPIGGLPGCAPWWWEYSIFLGKREGSITVEKECDITLWYNSDIIGLSYYDSGDWLYLFYTEVSQWYNSSITVW